MAQIFVFAMKLQCLRRCNAPEIAMRGKADFADVKFRNPMNTG
jgi:hypothetical protein